MLRKLLELKPRDVPFVVALRNTAAVTLPLSLSPQAASRNDAVIRMANLCALMEFSFVAACCQIFNARASAGI